MDTIVKTDLMILFLNDLLRAKVIDDEIYALAIRKIESLKNQPEAA